jgi:hypothetical protein
MQAEELSSILSIFTRRTGIKVLEAAGSSLRKSAINEIIRLRTDIGDLALRVRVNKAGFQYEDVVKEPIVNTLLAGESCPPGDILSRIGQKCLLPLPQGRFDDQVAFVPDLVFYMNCPASPYPVSISRWVDGELLWDSPAEESYRQSGVLLAAIHSRPCRVRGPDFKALSTRPLNVTDEILMTMEKFASAIAELSAAMGRLAAKAVKSAHPLATSLAAKGPRIALCHGDYHGGNLIRTPKQLYVIDWDNAVFGLPEMDLVKMRYWTARTGEKPSYVKKLYDAFMSGYLGALHGTGLKIDEEAERLSELMWLLRVMKFEIEGRATQMASHVSYGSAELYADNLERLTAD